MKEIDELFRENNIGLKEICEWFIQKYPSDIFTKGEVAQIRELCKKLLKKIKLSEQK